MKISAAALQRPVATLMAVAALLVFGLLASQRLPVRLYPDVDFPVVSVFVDYPGAAPDVVETRIARVLEESVGGIEGVKQIRSESRAGACRLVVEFDEGRELDHAAGDVRDKVASTMRQLPAGVEAPIVEKFDLNSAPVLELVVYGESSLADITTYAKDKLETRLEGCIGVGEVRLEGSADKEFRVWLRAEDLHSHAVTVDDVVDAFAHNHLDSTGGYLDVGGRQLLVKPATRLRSVADVRGLALNSRDHRPVWLGDVAHVEEGLAEQRTMVRFDGKPAVSLLLHKQSHADTVDVCQRIREQIDQVSCEASSGAIKRPQIAVVHDASRFVEASVGNVQRSLLLAGLLAVSVVGLGLRSLRGAAICAVVIPVTIISTYACMWCLGFTLNTMTMLALTIAAGMIIDDAIVVLDAIEHKLRTHRDRLRAGRMAMKETGFAVVATSLVVAAVFVPVAFTQGLIGRFFYEFGVTVAATVAISTLIALTVTPLLASRLLSAEAGSKLNGGPSAAMVQTSQQRYRQVLHWALDRPVSVLGLVAALTAVCFLILLHLGKEFVPAADEGQFLVQVEAPAGTSYAETLRASVELERRLAALPAVEHLLTKVGDDDGLGANRVKFLVSLTPRDDRSFAQDDVMQLARDLLTTSFPHINTIVDAVPRIQGGTAGQNAAMQLSLRGSRLEDLRDAARRISTALSQRPGFVDVTTSEQSSAPSIGVRIDRELAARAGVQADQVTTAIEALIGGRKVATYFDGRDEIDVRLRLPASERTSAAIIRNLPIRAGSGRITRLQTIAALSDEALPERILRQDRERVVYVYANPSHAQPLGDALAELEQLIADQPLPPDLEYSLAGDADRMRETFYAVGFSLLLAMAFCYMVLASQFEHLSYPLVVLVTIPIALAGGIVGLQLSHNTLNIYSMIAMIMLVGLAGKNAVLIVDRAIHLQRHGMAAKGAALQAAVERSRAVLLTAASTIAGAAPLCVNWGEGAELRLPMGFCIVGGMVSSTILSLIVVPVAFRLLAGWRPMQVGEQVEVAPCRGLPAKDSAQFEEEQLIAAC